jgi:hypothetical protein
LSGEFGASAFVFGEGLCFILVRGGIGQTF